MDHSDPHITSLDPPDVTARLPSGIGLTPLLLSPTSRNQEGRRTAHGELWI